jgi:lysophospholipase L1-like esterase
MENIFINFLPPWIETGLQPAFYDKESGTVLQQTARMYAKVNELTENFNTFTTNVATTVNDYIDQFNDLHDYVYDYFDNLDVQEEINNKLDKMVSDGTMSILLSGLLDDFRAEVQAELDLQDDKIDAVESGTLIASSTSEMTDHTRLYVNTTDGYWYYWNGTTWTQGGVYQSEKIADDSIKGAMIKLNTINPFSLAGVSQQPMKTVFKYARWVKGYRYYQGELVAAEGYVSSLPVPTYAVDGLTYTPTVTLVSPERMVTYRADGTFIVEGAITTAGWTPGTTPSFVAITMTEAHFESEGPDIVTVNYGDDKITIPWLEKDEAITNSILVYGDSLWANCNGNFNYTTTPYNQSTDPCYGYKQYLESLGMTVDNQAISGTTVVDCWNRTVGKFPQAISPETLSDYDTVILSFGRNDSRTGVALGELKPLSQSASIDPTTFYGAYQSIINTLLTKNPKLRIILWTMTQTNAGGYGTESTNNKGLKQIDYVNAVKNIANLYSANVVDMYNDSGINELNLQQYTFEGVHLTNDGYAFTSQYYKNAMANFLA